jgi:hypothetical protein
MTFLLRSQFPPALHLILIQKTDLKDLRLLPVSIRRHRVQTILRQVLLQAVYMLGNTHCKNDLMQVKTKRLMVVMRRLATTVLVITAAVCMKHILGDEMP